MASFIPADQTPLPARGGYLAEGVYHPSTYQVGGGFPVDYYPEAAANPVAATYSDGHISSTSASSEETLGRASIPSAQATDGTLSPRGRSVSVPRRTPPHARGIATPAHVAHGYGTRGSPYELPSWGTERRDAPHTARRTPPHARPARATLWRTPPHLRGRHIRVVDLSGPDPESPPALPQTPQAQIRRRKYHFAPIRTVQPLRDPLSPTSRRIIAEQEALLRSRAGQKRGRGDEADDEDVAGPVRKSPRLSGSHASLGGPGAVRRWGPPQLVRVPGCPFSWDRAVELASPASPLPSPPALADAQAHTPPRPAEWEISPVTPPLGQISEADVAVAPMSPHLPVAPTVADGWLLGNPEAIRKVRGFPKSPVKGRWAGRWRGRSTALAEWAELCEEVKRDVRSW